MKEQMVQFVKTEKTLHNISGMQIYGARPGQDDRSLPDWFYKVDIDGDGRTDLIMNGQWPILILDRGSKGYWTTALGYPGHDINSTRAGGHRHRRASSDAFACPAFLPPGPGGYVGLLSGERLFEYNPHPLKTLRFSGTGISYRGMRSLPVRTPFAVGQKGPSQVPGVGPQ